MGPEAMEGNGMNAVRSSIEVRQLLATLAAITAAFSAINFGAAQASSDPPNQDVIVVVGAPGEEDYSPRFHEWAERWRAATEQGNATYTAIGTQSENSTSDRDLLRQEIARRAAASPEPLWIVLIGHGTWDGKTARFNLRGPDVASTELEEWLKPVSRPLAVINCASCSGPFLTGLSGPNRVVITATRSGNEFNFARLGDYLSSAMTDPSADLDKDEQTSLLEAWILASARVREFYASDARLMTEHALLDDNGDRLGTPADWFQGVRAVKSAKAGAQLDGSLAGRFVLVRSTAESTLSPESRATRDRLEQELAELRRRKPDLPEAEYLQQLETLLLQLGRLYGEVDGAPARDDKSAGH
jgi:hypothetical protein